ncbi:diphthine--ammonia ligase-like [Patiria miniata]|uniref:Diphthine--ammonia ligase n=1 Tax=Patiria miniata TaxID=46514 RepID=A0A914B9U8_PATMI|nr:diphthine--ammonia ligase-like [Patiria miniata]
MIDDDESEPVTSKMKVVALVSGGKDSCYNMMQCVAEGHDLVALANLRPKQQDELDSYMYQTVGHHAIQLYAQALGLPLYRGVIEGSPKEQSKDYSITEGDEVEDLYRLLHKVKEELGVEGVSVGAILSDYQRVRVENVCCRLGLTPLAFLWRRDQEGLLKEMITAGVEAIIIKVAAMGLDSRHLGMTLQEIQSHMLRMKEKYQLNVCGEGGEFETFTLDCPLFAKKLKVKHQEMVNHSDDAFAPVWYLNLLGMELEEKQNVAEAFADRLKGIPMKRGSDLLQELEDLMDEESQGNPPCPVEDSNPNEDSNSTSDVATVTSSPICKISSEGYMWVSGLTPSRSDGWTIIESTEQAMESLKECLGNHGYDLLDVVIVHVYVKDMSNFSQINSVYCRYFQQNPPARVCVQVDLPCDTELQIDCLAHRNISRRKSSNDDVEVEPVHRHTMHVRSISHWAPANIGPYSQAVQIGDLVFSAGMIGLCPSTMRIVEGGITPQCALSLRSLQRLLMAMHPGASLSTVVCGVCYVTDSRHIDVARKHWEKFVKEGHSRSVRAHSAMSYVVVPYLPKGCLVEWQVAACVDSESWQGTSKSVQGNVSTSQLEINIDGTKSSGFIICSITPNMSSELQLLAVNLLDTMGACLKEQTSSWDRVLSVRVFYKQSVVARGQLLNALTAELEKASSAIPALCLVPVLSLPGSCVITALAFLQM